MPVLGLWPLALLAPSSWTWTLEGAPAQGGTPISGPPQTQDLSCGGWWTCSMSISLRTLPQHRAYRSALTALRSSMAKIVVPCLDALQPWPAGVHGSAVPFGDGSTFSDGALFTSDSITAVLAAAAYAPAYPAPPLAPTVAKIDGTVMAALLGGERYTLVGPSGEPRMHEIGLITDVTGSVSTVSVAPPHREDYAAGTQVALDRPACTMKLAGESYSQAAPTYRPGFTAEVTIKFVEAFPDPT